MKGGAEGEGQLGEGGGADLEEANVHQNGVEYVHKVAGLAEGAQERVCTGTTQRHQHPSPLPPHSPTVSTTAALVGAGQSLV